VWASLPTDQYPAMVAGGQMPFDDAIAGTCAHKARSRFAPARSAKTGRAARIRLRKTDLSSRIAISPSRATR